MQKRGIFIVLFIVFGLQLDAQQLSHKVLGVAGSVVSNGDYSISQTIGEPVVKMIGIDEFILTQGFQQPSAELFKPTNPNGSGVKVYPNPVRDNLVFELFGDQDLEYHITIFGFSGAIYYKKDYPCVGKFWHIVTLDVSSYARGTYFVRVVTEDGRISRLFKIEKM